MPPKLSLNSVDIIIPSYNSATFIIETLQSVFRQTHQNFHIYVVDDGSTDDTVTVVESFSKSNISVIRQSNSGPSRARNNGFSLGTGEFVAFLDSDDIWEPEFLEKSLLFLSAQADVACVFAEQRTFVGHSTIASHWCRNDGRLDRVAAEQLDGFGLILKDAWRELLPGTFIHLSATLFRRDCLDRVGLFDESLSNAEDRELFIRLSMRFDIGFIDQVLVHRRMRAESLSHDLHKAVKCSELLWRRLIQYDVVSFPYRMKIRKKLSRQWFWLGRDLLWKGSRGREVLSAFWMSFLRFPNFKSLLFMPLSFRKIYFSAEKFRKRNIRRG